MCYPKSFFFYFLLSSFHLPVYLSALYHPSMHGTFNKLLNDVWTRGPRVPDTVFHRITRWQVVGHYVSNACYPKFTAAPMKDVLFPAGLKLDCHSFIFKTCIVIRVPWKLGAAKCKSTTWDFGERRHRIQSDAATVLPRDCMKRSFWSPLAGCLPSAQWVSAPVSNCSVNKERKWKWMVVLNIFKWSALANRRYCHNCRRWYPELELKTTLRLRTRRNQLDN